MHTLQQKSTRAAEINLPPLPHAKDEIRTIKNIIANQYAITGDITEKQKLIDYFTNSSSLHIATHSLISDSIPMNSSLVFYNKEDDSYEFLYAFELLDLTTDLNLVVLSACQTGYGKFQRGEGIMSLARAFTYAGAKSTVMSLWKVPDESTAMIMVAFYKHLKSGMRKDDALRQAKLDYLDNTNEPELRHPFYWAGFIAQGDMSPIDFGDRKNSLWWIIGGMVFIGLAFLYHLHQKNRSKLDA